MERPTHKNKKLCSPLRQIFYDISKQIEANSLLSQFWYKSYVAMARNLLDYNSRVIIKLAPCIYSIFYPLFFDADTFRDFAQSSCTYLKYLNIIWKKVKCFSRKQNQLGLDTRERPAYIKSNISTRSLQATNYVIFHIVTI